MLDHLQCRKKPPKLDLTILQNLATQPPTRGGGITTNVQVRTPDAPSELTGAPKGLGVAHDLQVVECKRPGGSGLGG